MFDTLKSRIYQGTQYIKDIPNAPMRKQFRGFPVLTSGIDYKAALLSCPVHAIGENPLSVDMGKCTFCGLCAQKSSAIKFSNDYKLAATQRNSLIITPETDYESFRQKAIQANKEIKKVFGRSLKLRQVSAGGCNGCEMELNACSNVNFDMGRFGIDFVASPRHADGIVITGPVTKNMAYALEDCYKSIPSPKIVILCGACAVSGGIFQASDEISRDFIKTHKTDLYIPGCPVHPLTFINGILDFIK